MPFTNAEMLATINNIQLSRFLSQKALMQTAQLITDKQIIVPAHKLWLVLNGHISHITGTLSIVRFKSALTAANLFQVQVLAATGNVEADLFGGDTIEKVSGWRPIILSEGDQINFNGGVNAFVTVTILEVNDQ